MWSRCNKADSFQNKLSTYALGLKVVIYSIKYTWKQEELNHTPLHNSQHYSGFCVMACILYRTCIIIHTMQHYKVAILYYTLAHCLFVLDKQSGFLPYCPSSAACHFVPCRSLPLPFVFQELCSRVTVAKFAHGTFFQKWYFPSLI